MKEPDPPDDLDQTILETFDEMHADAQITPIFLAFPPKVIESVEVYAKEHSLRTSCVDPLCNQSHGNQLDEFSEAGTHLMEDPDCSPGLSKILCCA